MANQRLMKKVAPVVLSAAVAMTSMPAIAFAADFSDTEVTVAEESADIEEASAEAADTDVVEDTEDTDVDVEEAAEDVTEDEETSDEELFSAEVSEDESADETGEGQTEGEAYVLMNIPYDDFYKAELKNNDVKVDAFTSATLNKSRTAGMMNGNSAYHTDVEGTNLAGVTFPVKVSDLALLKDQKKVTDDDFVTITVTNKGQTASNTYTGKDSLIENASYSYYVLSEVPGYYKELTVNEDGSFTFSDVKGAQEKTVEATAELKTQSKYGDYQLKINNETFSSLISTSTDKIYGATVNTTDGTEYGMRHLENIWKGYELAWCTGFTTSVHGCPTSSEHYKSMMGKTIDSVTYYTDKGIITFDVNDEKVLTKTGVKATVANIHTTDTEAAVTLDGTLPEGFAAKYTVDGTEVAYADGKITTGTLAAGSHTLVISDENGEYAPIQASFYAKEAAVPAAYDAENSKLVPAEGSTEEQLTAYIKTITAVTVGDKTYQATGKGSKVIVKEDGTLDLTGIEVTNGTKFVVTSSGYDDFAFDYEVAEYKYVYAGLTWAEYWAAEGVQAAGSDAGSDETDSREESDKGAFDVVTRATTNHGLHRGSFQCAATIYMKDGTTYDVAYYTAATTAVLTNGETVTYDKSQIDHYEVKGLKYVPVKVSEDDYEDFCKKYVVVENGGTLSGGFSENKLQSYTGLVADVTENTNGLKIAVKNADGSFSFSARTTGSESGIKDQALKTAPDAETVGLTVKEANGSYGEFLRVDLTGNYGDLGGAMQAVKWTYYGNDSTCTNALQTYGTKFAADNWMHKSMGIQLGLTKSLRCQLPEGYDGTGYWTLTVYALGYEDFTVQFQATDANIVKPAKEEVDTTALEAVIAEAKALKESDYTPASWVNVANELEECEEMLANIDKQTQNGVDEQITHLREAIDSLVKAEFKLNAASGTLYTQDKTSTTLKVTTNLAGTVTWKSSNTKVATVDSKGVVTAKAAGTANITATLNGKTATYKVTVKNAMSINKTAVTVYVGGTPASYTLKATSAIGGTVKYATSNKSVATVSSKGVVTAKKAGTAVITATAGKAKITCKVTVKNPSIAAKAAKTTIYTKGQTSTTIAVTKSGVSGTAKFTSSNKNIATVDSKGVVRAKKAGTVKITVQVGKLKKVVTVSVKNASLKLSRTAATINRGKTTTIKVSAVPTGKVTYTSSNKGVATVTSKGVVKGVKKGTVVITVKCSGMTAKFKVTVK